MDNILNLIGIAKKAGKLEIGEEPVGAAARARHAKLLLLAADAAENTARRASHFGEAGNVRVLSLPYTKAELGTVVGRTSCAMLAVMDAGIASSIVTKLAAASPEQYGEAAEQLATKAAKVLKRQKEQRQHEKNLQRGKTKPWAASAQKTGAEARLAEKTAVPTQNAPAARRKAADSAPAKGDKRAANRTYRREKREASSDVNKTK